MKIVFDTNIWISDLGLNSEAGAAVRFYIKKTGAIVVVPEVVQAIFHNPGNDISRFLDEVVWIVIIVASSIYHTPRLRRQNGASVN